jgi:hypothetical protein
MRKLLYLHKTAIPLINTNLSRKQISTKYSKQQESFVFNRTVSRICGTSNQIRKYFIILKHTSSEQDLHVS